ncbi:MAG TPA: protein kinase, partial [Polyangia bacterium]|nr:protein kinase [Polyangia bacterium]
MSVSPSTLDPGAILADRFVVQSPIAPGLYRAFDRTLGRLVALQLVDPQVARERREAIHAAVRAARLVLHPNVVLFHEFHEEPPPFYATELLYGESLEARLRRVGHLGADEVSGFVEALGGAVAAIHEAGVVHGQLRPRDIILRSDGSAVIALPALARVAAPAVTDARRDEQAYVAPESRHGGDPAAPSDVYALGAIAYHALYGLPPPLDPHLPDVSLSTTSLQLARLIGRCMDPSPSARPLAREVAVQARAEPPPLFSSTGSTPAIETEVSAVRRPIARSSSPLLFGAIGALTLTAVAMGVVWIGRARESSERLHLSVGAMTLSGEAGWGEAAFRRLLARALEEDRRIRLGTSSELGSEVSVEGLVELKGEEAAATLRTRPAHGGPWDLKCSGRGLAGAATRCASELARRLLGARPEPTPDADERREMREAGISTLPGYQTYLQARHAMHRSDWSVPVSDAFLKLGRIEPDCPFGVDAYWVEVPSTEQAMARLRQIVPRLPLGPPRLFAEVDLAFHDRDVGRVRSLAVEVRQKTPDSALAHEAVVNALLHLGLRTEARAFGEEALRRHPDWTAIWDEVLGQYEEDELRTEVARQFVEAQPELTLSHLVAAKALVTAGRSKEAAEEYRRAELLAPDDTQVSGGRAALELQEDRLAVAERYARRLLTLGPDGEVQGYLWLGDLKALRGRFGEAFKFWERGDEVSARRPTGWSQSAIVCAMSSRRNRLLTALELGDRDAMRRAADALARWVKLRSWNLGYQASGLMLAQIADWRAGTLDRGALDKFVEAYAADPKHAVTPPLLGMVRVVEAMHARDAAMGMQAARELADVAGPAEQYAAGFAFFLAGDLKAAQTRLKEVATRPFADTERAFKMLSPYHRIEALYRLAQIYEREKRMPE